MSDDEVFAVILLAAVAVCVVTYVSRKSGAEGRRQNLTGIAQGDEKTAQDRLPLRPDSGKPVYGKAPLSVVAPEVETIVPKGPAIPSNLEISGKCYVIDGDTIAINKVKIRLAGIDAPELDMPYGQKSKWDMVKICKGEVITVKLTGERSYDRLVGTCYLADGTDIGAELIQRGLALDYTPFSKGKYKHLEVAGMRKKLWFLRKKWEAGQITQ